ncbi:MAG: hypothetical protein R6X10_13090 [Desulfobacterales bacterium]
MVAKDTETLKRLLKENPDESPSVFLSDDSLAADCYDNRTIRELKSAFHRDADPKECEAWGLSSSEWKENIEMALVALRAAQKKHTR